MGWYDCFDFEKNKYTQPDTKASEIYRVLYDGGRITCCSWEAQEDLAWMEAAMLQYHPELLLDNEFLAERPIGMAYEKPAGYEVILKAAGFSQIESMNETAEFISTNEEEWWRQMEMVGWRSFLGKISQKNAEQLQGIKDAIFRDLQTFKQPDGIHFTKSVFYVNGVK